MFNKYITNQSVVDNSSLNPRYLVKVTDREGKVTIIQTELIRKITTFNGGAFVHLPEGGFIELNLPVDELFTQIQTQLDSITPNDVLTCSNRGS